MESNKSLKVGVYIDGFNLYYGGNHLVGDSSWKWLDLRKLIKQHIPQSLPWRDCELVRIIYFTSQIREPLENFKRQQVYLEALLVSGSVDFIEYGNFVSRMSSNFAAIGKKDKYDYVTLTYDPLPNEEWFWIEPTGLVKVSHEKREEKGSDVKLASHLLIDLLTKKLDAAIVVTNDADLAYPIKFAREHVPVGVINPRGPHTARDLLGKSDDGVGNHWWYTLKAENFLSAQLPDEFDGMVKPQKWRV